MTRDELVGLLRSAIADPGQYAPRRYVDHNQENFPTWAARAVLAALRSPEDEPHVLDVWKDGETWSLGHPLPCRFDDDATCPVYQAAQWLDGPPAKPGRYVVTTDDDGELIVGERVT
jgi:hypothetical protein